MESVVESLLGNARCEESSFGRVGSRHQRGQQRHCPAKLRNNAQNRTELPQMGILRMVLREQKSTLNQSNKCQCVAAKMQSDELEGLQ